MGLEIACRRRKSLLYIVKRDALLIASVPRSAVARLEAIEARLDATWRAILAIQVALATFETKLNDEQKQRFDAMSFAGQ